MALSLDHRVSHHHMRHRRTRALFLRHSGHILLSYAPLYALFPLTFGGYTLYIEDLMALSWLEQS